MVQQQQPRLPAQKFGRPSTQQPPRQQFTGQQSFIQNQNAQTNTQLSGPRQSTVSTKTRSFYINTFSFLSTRVLQLLLLKGMCNPHSSSQDFSPLQ